MPPMIFVNLPVADVARATAFYEAIGFRRNPAFSNDQAACMVWSETISFMLLGHDVYRTFTAKQIADTHGVSAALLCLSQPSREAVAAVADKAVAAGGRETRPPQDMGAMVGRSVEDLDGHTLELMWMDPAAMPAGA